MSLANKLAEERRGRLAAERLLELKQAELFAANRKLGLHAQALSEEIVETRAEVAIVRDENLRFKSELTSAHQKIEIVERRLWQTIETINDSFAFYSPDLELIMANRAFLALFDGLEVIQPGVNYVTILQMMTDEGIVNTGDMNPADWRQMMTERMQARDPEPVTVKLWNHEYIKVIDQRGPDGDIVSLGLNITAAVRYEAQLDEARRIAESANRAKSAFLANMSHEIRTPMNGVVGMAEVLAETALNEEQRLYVDTIRNSGEALLVIINDVLDYSKIEADKLELRSEPFDLERSIHEVVMLLETAARDKELELVVDYDMHLPSVFLGDPGRLRQVLTNLVGNAVKFTNEGGIAVRVRGDWSGVGEACKLKIEIEDTGIGIPPDKIEHIFGEFHQVENDRNRKFDGTGLGLAISKRLISMMGGEIGVTSTEGLGSCFSLDLSLETSKPETAPALARPVGLKRVLLLDHEGLARDTLSGQLLNLGLQVRTPATSEKVRACLANGVDIVILDKNLIDGTNEYSRALRDKSPSCPVLLLSDRAGNISSDAETPANCEILSRPYLRQDLLEKFAAMSEVAGKTCRGTESLQDKVVPVSQPADLPVFVHGRAAEATKAPSASNVESEAPRRMRVLAAEDNRTNQLVFGKMIKDLDIDLRFASNGKEAVQEFSVFAPDIIFMDISMPIMDGKEAAGEIRKIEEETGAHVPIVALTAHAMDGDDAAVLAAGLDRYMTKPLRKAEIVQTILDHAFDGLLHPLTGTHENAAE